MTHDDRDGSRAIPRMTCGGCGATMNPHAEKPIVPVADEEVGEIDWAVGGIVEEVHQCPGCGWVQARRA
jgi:ribosomal protein S27AE